jgi:hypothetical protein
MSTKAQKAKVKNVQEWILLRRAARAMKALHRLNPMPIYENMISILEQEERRNVVERNQSQVNNGG